MMHKKILANSEEAYDENAQTIPLEKLFMMSDETPAVVKSEAVSSAPGLKFSGTGKPEASKPVEIEKKAPAPVKKEEPSVKKEEKSGWFNTAGDL